MGRSGKLIAINDKYVNDLLLDNRYQVREDGTIWTSISEQGHDHGYWRQCKQIKNGYVAVSYTTSDGKRKNLAGHRIVYAKFIGKLEEDLVINHINGITSDNRLENLELGTQGDNNTHRFQVLGHDAVIGNKKISDEIADQIREDHRNGLSYNKLTEKYGMAKSSISYIINKKTWNRKVDSDHTFLYKTKLNFELAQQIRVEYSAGESQKDLAKKYGVGLTSIKDVCSNRKWITK